MFLLLTLDDCSEIYDVVMPSTNVHTTIAKTYYPSDGGHDDDEVDEGAKSCFEITENLIC